MLVILDVNDPSIKVCPAQGSLGFEREIQNAIQTWIALAYLHVASQWERSTSSNISSSKVTNLQQWLEISTACVKNIHVRIEQPYQSHIPVTNKEVRL